MSDNQISLQSTNFLIDTKSLESAYRLANAFHKAQCFNNTVKNPEQALIVLLAGNEAGLQPVESMNYFYFVKNTLNMYGGGLAKVISRGGVNIKYVELNKNKITVEYSKNNQLLQRLEYSSGDLPATSQAKKFAPEEKLVYHAHSRFLRYNDVGVSIPYTDYDQDIIETKESVKVILATKENELIKFITSEVSTLEALQSVENQIDTEEEKLAYDIKFAEFNKPKTSDGSLIEDNQQPTDV